jgi:hypothetical protein
MKTRTLNKVRRSRVNAALAPSHEEIAMKAEVLWRQKGCPENCDEEIWLEAEQQLCDVATTDKEEQDEKAFSDPLPRLDDKSDGVMGELEELYPGQTGKETTSL